MAIDKVVSFRVTDEEFKQIRKAADKSLRTISNWLRKLVVKEIGK